MQRHRVISLVCLRFVLFSGKGREEKTGLALGPKIASEPLHCRPLGVAVTECRLLVPNHSHPIRISGMEARNVHFLRNFPKSFLGLTAVK